MKTSPPPGRRKFASDWDEIEYLYHKLLYWLYRREDVGKARSYADRLERLLRQAAPNHQAILGEECWSLVHETRGNLRKAIEHRENEIHLIRRLHQMARNAPQAEHLLKDYGYEALSDRLDLLATLYHDSGDLENAIRALEESQQLCDAQRITFDGKDLLDEYLGEKRSLFDARKRSQPRASASVWRTKSSPRHS